MPLEKEESQVQSLLFAAFQSLLFFFSPMWLSLFIHSFIPLVLTFFLKDLQVILWLFVTLFLLRMCLAM